MTARWPPPSSERCACSPRDAPALPRGRRHPVARRRVARGASLRACPPRAWAGRGSAGGPRRRATVASSRRARRPTANGRGRQPERGRDSGAAPRSARRDVPAADADQALGDLARQPLLRARACKRAPAPRRHARSRARSSRFLPTSTSSCTRASTASALRRSRSRALSQRSPIRPCLSWNPPSVAVPMPVWPRRSLRGSSSWTGSACDSPIRCSDLRSLHARRLRADGRCTLGSRRSFRPPRNELGTSRSRRPSRVATIASILEDAARSAHARGAPATAAELAEQALGSRPPRVRTTPDGAYSSRPTCTAAPETPTARPLCSSEARAAAAPGTERATVLAHLAGVQASPPDAVALYREALSEAEGDDALQATIHLGLAGLMRLERRESSAASSTANSPSARPRAWPTLDAPLPRTRGVRPACTSTRDAASARRWKRRSRSSDRWPSGRSTTAQRHVRSPARLVCGRRPRAGRSSRRF